MLKRYFLIFVALALLVCGVVYFIGIKDDLFFRMPKCSEFIFEGRTVGCDFSIRFEDDSYVGVVVTYGLIKQDNQLFVKTARIGTEGTVVLEKLRVGVLTDNDPGLVFNKQITRKLLPVSSDLESKIVSVKEFELLYKQNKLIGKVVALHCQKIEGDDAIKLTQLFVYK